MPDEEFEEHVLEVAAIWPRVEFTEENVQRGMLYPWERPDHSYVLSEDEVSRVEAGDPRLEDLEDRHALIAFGANAAPAALGAKLQWTECDREAIVLTGELVGYDVVACGHVALYGALAGTLHHSPGTHVRASLILATSAQFQALSMLEVPYAIARIPGSPFISDVGAETPDSVFAFVSRGGQLLVDGEPAALAAIPASNRTFEAFEQRELLEYVARNTLGEDVDTTELVRRVYADPVWCAGELRHAMADICSDWDLSDWDLFAG